MAPTSSSTAKTPKATALSFATSSSFPVDAGHGWLIFALPPAEAAFDPSEKNDLHELYFMCDDLKATMESLKGKKVSAVTEERWGSLTTISLPGGGKVGLYQPKHPTAIGR
jgi:hypothetical protein